MLCINKRVECLIFLHGIALVCAKMFVNDISELELSSTRFNRAIKDLMILSDLLIFRG